MFEKKSCDGYKDVLQGVRQKALVHGEKTLMVEFQLEKGALLPLHSHPHEQTGFLVSGRIGLLIGGKRHDVLPGDSWCIAAGEEHCAEILEDSVAVEVFSPVREDYLPG